MRTFTIVLVTCLVVILGLGDGKGAESGSSDSAAQPKGSLRVFFIGNSHTGNLREVIQRLAFRGKPGIDMITAGHIVGGCTLERHWNEGNALAKMMKDRWDVVVLQENGQGPLAYPDKMRKYALMFDDEIKKAGAKTVLFMTAAYQDQPETMKTIAKTYLEIGKELEADVAPIGLAFEKSLKKRPDLTLHNLPDTVHANQRGTYLTASVFWTTLTGEKLRGLSRGGLAELTGEEILFLQEIAWKTVIEYKAKGGDKRINAKDGDGLTPLHYAMKADHRDTAELLLSEQIRPLSGDLAQIALARKRLQQSTNHAALFEKKLLDIEELLVHLNIEDLMTALEWDKLKSLKITEVLDSLAEQNKEYFANNPELPSDGAELRILSLLKNAINEFFEAGRILDESDAAEDDDALFSKMLDVLGKRQELAAQQVFARLIKNLADWQEKTAELETKVAAIEARHVIEVEKELSDAKQKVEDARKFVPSSSDLEGVFHGLPESLRRFLTPELEELQTETVASLRDDSYFLHDGIRENQIGMSDIELSAYIDEWTSKMDDLESRDNRNKEQEEELEILKKQLSWFEKVKYVIKASDMSGETPLHIAAYSGHKDAVELLLAKGADINAKTYYNGMTPLLHAVQGSHIDVVEVLIDNGADVNAKNNNGLFPLFLAARSGQKEVAEMLIENGADVNAKHVAGRTSLHSAAAEGYKDVVELLIENGVDFRAADEDGVTPLHTTTEYGHIDIVILLIDKGADVNAKDKWIWTPLHYACWKNDKDTAEFLITKGANINAKDNSGKTPLHRAAQKGREEIVRLLIDKGAEIKAKENRQLTALHSLAWYGQQDSINMMEFLLARGADIEAKSMWGTTPLFFAVQNGKLESTQFLLNKGANINAKDNNGKTPLSVAKEKGRTEMVELLLKHGAKE